MKQILDYGLELENVKEYKINLSQKQSIELLKDTLNKFEIRGEQLYLLKIAIENILEELEQKDKRIKELEEENKRKDMFVEMAKEVIENSILKRVVIEVLEDIEDYFDRLNGLDEDMDYIRKIKKELLEGEK